MGRPRKDGSPARARLPVRVGTELKFVADTNANRRKYGITGPVGAPVPGASEGIDAAKPIKQPDAETLAGGAATARETVASAFPGGSTGGSSTPAKGSAPAADASYPAIDYKIVTRTANGIIATVAPDAVMTKDEETAIGEALDAVIAKHWPELKNAGPEFALTLAVGAYITRVVIMPMMDARQKQRRAVSEARPSPFMPDKSTSDVDPFANTIKD